MHKRHEMRRSYGMPLEVITSEWNQPIELTARDLSPRGTFIESDIVPDFGDQIVCSFKMGPDKPEYCFFGEVTRVNLHRRKTDRGRAGFGVRFLDATPMERLNIREALIGRPPVIPSPGREVVETVSWKMVL